MLASRGLHHKACHCSPKAQSLAPFSPSGLSRPVEWDQTCRCCGCSDCTCEGSMGRTSWARAWGASEAASCCSWSGGREMAPPGMATRVAHWGPNSACRSSGLSWPPAEALAACARAITACWICSGVAIASAACTTPASCQNGCQAALPGPAGLFPALVLSYAAAMLARTEDSGAILD